MQSIGVVGEEESGPVAWLTAHAWAEHDLRGSLRPGEVLDVLDEAAGRESSASSGAAEAVDHDRDVAARAHHPARVGELAVR